MLLVGFQPVGDVPVEDLLGGADPGILVLADVGERAVELLLADCYVRRDEVAVIAFRGKGAELLLPPTRSLVRAKRALAGLPGGGGTPLAHALEASGITGVLYEDVNDPHGVALLTLTPAEAQRLREQGVAREVLDELAALEPVSGELISRGHGVLYWQVARGDTLGSAISKTMGKKRYKSSTTTRNLRTVEKVLTAG